VERNYFAKHTFTQQLQMYIEHGIKKNKGIFNRHHICRVC
jgi:hypothetical protein